MGKLRMTGNVAQAKLEKERDKLKQCICFFNAGGDYEKLKHLLQSWRGSNAYVHNLNQTNDNYSQIRCSDLEYLAKSHVQYQEPKYESLTDTETMKTMHNTVLGLALRMTRKNNERVLMGFLYEKWDVGDQDSMIQRRVDIVRILLESGFLWGSGDLVCEVVPEKEGYHKEVREAFARTVLHDLVRNDIHLDKDQLMLMKKSEKCGGNEMDGVVWVLAQAPGAFTMLGLLEPQTVLMCDAQDRDAHDHASIDFKELVQLYMVMQKPLTTVDPYGWNAEMLAARLLRRHHVAILWQEVQDTWRLDYKEAFKKWSGLPEWLTNAMATSYVNASLRLHVFGWLCFIIFLLVFLILLMVFVPYAFHRMCGLVALRGILRWASEHGGSFLFVDMSFRVLWLMMINTAFLQVPPLLITCFENQVLPGLGIIPSVTFWNPLPITAVVISVLCLVSASKWAYDDYQEPETKQNEQKAEDKSIPEDRFQDPTCHLIGCICIFFLVTILMIIYIRTILQPLEMNPKRMFLWWCAQLVQVKITLDDKTLKQEVQDLKRLRDAIQKTEHHEDHEFCHYSQLRLCENLASDFENPGPGLEKDEVTKPTPHPAPEQHFADVVRELSGHWLRWACCMVTPENKTMWGLHLLANRWTSHMERESKETLEVPYSDDWAEVVKKEMEGKDLMSYVVRQTNDEKSIEFKANEPALSSIPTRDKFPPLHQAS
ncbi:unnamed protein product [Durusdinium trenchii]|uniref:Uncharacterized protein n=1 Tax=Durusdinium trenchii TaxID=1381693 RepID=A0ABP0KXG5_9DINO